MLYKLSVKENNIYDINDIETRLEHDPNFVLTIFYHENWASDICANGKLI